MSGAKRTVGTSSSQWDLHVWHRCQADAETWSFPDQNAAALWLKHFKSDSIAMASLRSLVLQHGVGLSPRQNGDDKLLEEVAWLLSRGVLHVHKVPARRTAWNTGQNESGSGSSSGAAPATPRSAASQPASAPAKVAEEQATFSSQTDAAATAAGLRSAAVSGAPFCEECAKAAAARLAA